MIVYEQLNTLNGIAIFGRKGSGKTALAFKLLEQFRGHKPIYVLSHPKPEMIKALGYFNLNSMDEVIRLENCVIYWDEPQLSLLGIKEYKKDDILAKFMSLARQKDINLIVSTSDTRTFSPKVEQYFDGWFIKDCDYALTKQRSFLRTIIQNYTTFFAEEFSLKQDEVIFYAKSLREFCGLMRFTLPITWTEAMSKPYKQEVYVQGIGNEKNLITSFSAPSPETHKTKKKLT